MSGAIVAVEKYSSMTRQPGRRRALTPVWAPGSEPTFIAPVSDPHGRTQRQGWNLFSRDGLWHYERYEAGKRTEWRVVLLPTGQSREGYGGKDDARAATADALIVEMRQQAFVHALRLPLSDPRRENGHRCLAVHLRLAGVVAGQEATHRCACGGLLGTVTSDCDLAHLDACDDCYTYGKGLPVRPCEHADRHRFCGDPLALGRFIGCGLWREFCCPGDCRPE